MLGVLRIFGEVFVDLRPEGCPNPPGGRPKPLGFWSWTYGALLIGPIGPYKGPIGPYKGPNRALLGPYNIGTYFPFVGRPIFALWAGNTNF